MVISLLESVDRWVSTGEAGVKLSAMGVSRSTKEWEIAETGMP